MKNGTARALFLCAVSCAFLFSGCSRNKESAGTAASTLRHEFLTWDALHSKQAETFSVPEESLPPANARPFAGIVSHHLLAYNQIDRWFSELASRRNQDIKTFIILSPSHWGLSAGDFSVTFGSWLTSDDVVETNIDAETQLRDALSPNVYIEDSVFDAEHGVSVLIPFIHRYFPQAHIASVAYKGEPPLNQVRAQQLTTALRPLLYKRNFFTRIEKLRSDVFLLISADFSHHGDIAGTEAKDTRTRLFFTKSSTDTWIFAGCDNRPGIYALAHLMPPETHCTVLYHTNSFALSGMDADDITSYFFAYFWTNGSR